MRGFKAHFFLCTVLLGYGDCIKYDNETMEPANRQLLDFKLEHPEPIGLWTKSSGEPTEVRDTISVNSDMFNNQLLLDSMTLLSGERIPERIVHAKGASAYGYFVVTNDVSKYTYADVFNGVGKKTPVVIRLSSSIENLGGNDLAREFKGFAVKFYTKEGNLDITCLQFPVYLYRDPVMFPSALHNFKRNPVTNLFDMTMRWDAIIQNPILAHSFLWTMTDFGVPNGYRKMDAFPIHTFELANKHGQRHYVRFSFRTEQGLESLSTAQAQQIGDADYFNRDLYNAIERKEYPSWRLEMDVLSLKDLKTVDYDPFDVTRLWANGTYSTITIGRLILNRNVENAFQVMEQSAFNPSNLVPGIPGPVDFLFKGRKVAYRDTQNYRLGRNHNRIKVNMPLYAKTINRDGQPPIRDNERDAPNYYPNTFNGVVPFVDERMPKEKLIVLERVNAVDLEPISQLYNEILATEDHRQRFSTNIAFSLVPVIPKVRERVVNLMYLVDHKLGTNVNATLTALLAERNARSTTVAPKVPIDVPNTNKQHKRAAEPVFPAANIHEGILSM